MNAKPAEHVCSNPECKVSTTGTCIEGLLLDQCRHYGEDKLVIDDIGEAADQPTTKRPTSLPLCSAQVLDASEASRILASPNARLIAVIGPRDAGKTSLIASVYELFGFNRIENYRFAGSRTLISFEQTCHDSRAECGRQVAATERTAVNSFGFYHLSMVRLSTEEFTHVLWADRAGENYTSLMNGDKNANELPELAAASVITVLVDGERLADGKERRTAIRTIELMMQGIVEAKALAVKPSLAIILTKEDKISGNQVVSDHFSRLVEKFKRLYALNFARIDGFLIAASPTEPMWRKGHGVAAVIDFWQTAPTEAFVAVEDHATPSRQFARLSPIGDTL